MSILQDMIMFDQTYYLNQNPDVKAAYLSGQVDPWEHYVLFGGKELRAPNAVFNPEYYLLQNPDVIQAVASGQFANAFHHFYTYGLIEGRVPSEAYADFDADTYLAANPDVKEAIESGAFAGSAFFHFVEYGYDEGRPGGITPSTPGQTFTLTTGVDTETGTAGNDIFNAPLAGTGVNTLTDFDDLDGGMGRDTLNARLVDDVDNVSLANIEVLNFRASDDATVDAANFSNVEEIWSDRSTADLQINNLGEAVTIGLNRVADAQSFTVGYAATGIAADLQNVVITDSGAESAPVTLEIVNPSIGMAINSTGTENFLILGANLNVVENLELSGAADLTLSGNDDFVSLKDLDASAMTGDLSIAVTDALIGATDVELVGGAGDNDTLVLADTANGLDALDFDNVSGFEVLGFGSDVTLAADDTLDLADTGFNNVVFQGDLVGGGSTLAINGLESGAAITFEGDVTNINLDLDIEGTLTLNFEADADILGFFAADLEVLVLAGEGTVDIVLGDGTDGVESLTTIDMIDFEGILNIDAAGAVYGEDVTIMIGEGVELNYTAGATDIQEIFQFHGDDIGDITIDDFVAGVGGNADRLDFSQFAAVTSLANLTIAFDGTDSTVVAKNDEFDGTITVNGVDLSADAVNFIF
ncbi:hypothetical protein [Desulfonatronum lacustre]|uniref:hypothetical protein n=1 Tax=Desulfonatronum lacustre TaxID=66849 RepID=UPI0004908049|nr:hypothetical protein [Desulfonatronum lacustre]